MASDVERANPDANASYEEAAARSALIILKAAEQKASVRDVARALLSFASESLAEAVLTVAYQRDCDLTILASRDR